MAGFTPIFKNFFFPKDFKGQRIRDLWQPVRIRYLEETRQGREGVLGWLRGVASAWGQAGNLPVLHDTSSSDLDQSSVPVPPAGPGLQIIRVPKYCHARC